MRKPAKVQKPKIEDEPGAEERFMRGIGKALSTPPKPFTPPAKKTALSKKVKTK
jgi:hypothetical protein